MGNFKFSATGLAGLYLVESKVYSDERGWFAEVYQQEAFCQAGLTAHFVQDNQSHSHHGVLRGLHYQAIHSQIKLVRVVKGAVYDVVVDLRKNSPTCRQWYGVILSAENMKQLYIPQGFAHGFLVLSADADLHYRCSDFYHPDDEGGILWNDPALGIAWPLEKVSNLILSARDKAWPCLD